MDLKDNIELESPRVLHNNSWTCHIEKSFLNLKLTLYFKQYFFQRLCENAKKVYLKQEMILKSLKPSL